MSSFTLLNPWYLIGLLSALIPLIIHLSRSRRTKKMRFSTTRFFTDQFLRSYRMSRLREVLLLIFRMALFGLLALALTQPFVRPRQTGGLVAGGGPKTVVIVLDDSASMTYLENGVPVFKRAQEAASTILRNLGSGDDAALVFAGARAGGPLTPFAEPTADVDEVGRAVDRASASALGTDLSAAIVRAEEIAAAGRASGRAAVIYVVGDLQDAGWDLPASRVSITDVSYVFVGVRPKDAPANRAVTAVRYAATRPRVGVPFAVRPLLALGNDDGKDASVRLVVDGAKVGEQKVERLPGGKWASPRFYHTFNGGGWHAGHVEIDDDGLSADNKRYFAIEVPESAQTVPVLAVNGAPSSVAHQDELFFLRLALTAAPEGQKAPFDIRAVSPAEVAALELSKYPLVILANVERLSDGAVEKLEEYADGGGNVLVFLGDKVNPAWYNATLAGANRRQGGLLPATVKGVAPKDVGFVGAMNYEHRALAAFQEPKLGTLLGPTLTFKALELEAPASAVLMKASSGVPLLCEKEYGKGKVLLFASTCDRDWGDFVIKPAFLLWSRFVAEHLTQSALSLQSGYRTGDAVRLLPPADEKGTLWVRKPDGTKVVAPKASDGSGAFEFVETTTPGVYGVFRSDQETRVGMFAVNLDAYESDLTYLDEESPGESREERVKAITEELRTRLGGAPLVSYVDDPAALNDGGGGGSGWKLWTVLLVLVLLIAIVEPWLANQISSRLFPGTQRPAVGGQAAVGVANKPEGVAV